MAIESRLHRRLFPRSGRGAARVGHEGGQRASCDLWRRFLCDDLWHTIMSLRTSLLVTVLLIVYLLLLLAFCPLYLAISDRCAMGIDSLSDAYYFSLITISTIGYGTAQNNFDECWEAGVVITIHWLSGAFVNALCLASIFMRVGRSNRRASTILFSRQAVLQKIDGEYYLAFQVVDLSRYALCESHMRCYTLSSTTSANGGEWAQHSAMRIEQPDDDRGSTLFLDLPTRIVHRIDAWSPLAPPPNSTSSPCAAAAAAAPARGGSDEVEVEAEAASEGAVQTAPLLGGGGDGNGGGAHAHVARSSYRYPEVLQRASDCAVGNRAIAICEVCGDSYETPLALLLHQISSQVDDRMSGHDVSTTNMKTGEAFQSHETLRRSHVALELELLDAIDSGDDDKEGAAAVTAVGVVGGGETLQKEEKKTVVTGCRSPLSSPSKRRSRRVGSAAGIPIAQTAHSCFNHALCRMVIDSARTAVGAKQTIGAGADVPEASMPPTITAARELLTALIESDAPLPPRLEEILQRHVSKRHRIESWLEECGAEIVVVVEGQEAISGCTVAAHYSYSWAHGDIVVDHAFVPCLKRARRIGAASGEEGDKAAAGDKADAGSAFVAAALRKVLRQPPPAVSIDLDAFHKIVPSSNSGAENRETCSHT